MEEINNAPDANGTDIKRGDIVTTLNDHTSSRIVDVACDLETYFVRLKPINYSVGKGVWHAAEHVLLLRAAKVTN